MAEFDDLVASAAVQTFAHVGSPALWRLLAGGVDIPVKIIDAPEDKVVGFGDSDLIVPANVVRVLASQVPFPAVGDLVIKPALTYRVIAEPQLQAGGEWLCEVAAV